MDEKQREKIIIIGSGPAGLTAGIYAARANLEPLIIEGDKPGGQLMGTSYVENWPGNKQILGPTLMINMREHATHVGCRFLAQSIVEVDFSKKPFLITTTGGSTLNTHAIIIATGAAPKKLGCPGENEYWGKGVTTCAVCDGAFYKDKKVMVVGGGDTAMEDASFLHKFTKNITIVHILDKLTASAQMQKRVLENPDIHVIYNSTISEFKGVGEKLTAAIIKNQKNGTFHTIPLDGAFIAIGQRPNTAIFTHQLELSNYGYIITQNGTKTSIDGIFAAGDVSDPIYRQAITSAGSGCMAALDAERYLANLLSF